MSSTGSGPEIVAGMPDDPGTDGMHTRGVLSNPRFMALFLSQILTQVGGNMVLYGLTIQVFNLTGSTTSTAMLLLTFLVPAVVFGAIAGVFVDRYDRRKILIWTNLARGVLFVALVFFDTNLLAIYLITAIVATLTTFFAPAETAMIPLVVKRSDLMTANGLFVLGLQASFALGFAVLGPLVLAVTGVERAHRHRGRHCTWSLACCAGPCRPRRRSCATSRATQCVRSVSRSGRRCPSSRTAWSTSGTTTTSSGP